MLRNPFYSGTIVYRKSYVPDYLEQKPKMNYGDVDQVIVEGSLSYEQKGNQSKNAKSNLWYIFIPKNCNKTLLK